MLLGMRPFAPLALCLLFLLTGCNEPRTPAISRSESLRDRAPLQVRVVKVWNQSTDRIESDNDPHVSHFIEVDVIAGERKGDKLTLPFDAWNVGREPPSRGTELVIAPADWVQRDPRSKGREFGAW